METTNQIHAHDVLGLIDENAGAYDTTTLPAKLREFFGGEATYYACTASGMTPEELIGFLFNREKIVETDGKLYLNRANICPH